MKTQKWMTAVMVLAMMGAISMACAAETDCDTEMQGRRGRRPCQKMLEEFDADGDGQLSDEERQTARESMKGRGGRGGRRGPKSEEE